MEKSREHQEQNLQREYQGKNQELTHMLLETQMELANKVSTRVALPCEMLLKDVAADGRGAKAAGHDAIDVQPRARRQARAGDSKGKSAANQGAVEVAAGAADVGGEQRFQRCSEQWGGQGAGAEHYPAARLG